MEHAADLSPGTYAFHGSLHLTRNTQYTTPPTLLQAFAQVFEVVSCATSAAAVASPRLTVSRCLRPGHRHYHRFFCRITADILGRIHVTQSICKPPRRGDENEDYQEIIYAAADGLKRHPPPPAKPWPLPLMLCPRWGSPLSEPDSPAAPAPALLALPAPAAATAHPSYRRPRCHLAPPSRDASYLRSGAIQYTLRTTNVWATPTTRGPLVAGPSPPAGTNARRKRKR
ncbi:uncharacterized protein BO97DRAFT_422155 [Aspergillus homomorphus CBS 101889]|uniref:Uncharacterized protein n=1 Tax=Aspergillus homomorphus (strain CBS 101889) TaxID=1450537 RepID=A0A395I3M1_ASPHC|nr:hypothetical protein BO97DRAFT_422155 [Aspergillus homomorphus CBS 101889]RAL14802.1 hypothetical protein BO97DRAFT_422155 [Aspergillus homomorphus CBS 101889]